MLKYNDIGNSNYMKKTAFALDTFFIPIISAVSADRKSL